MMLLNTPQTYHCRKYWLHHKYKDPETQRDWGQLSQITQSEWQHWADARSLWLYFLTKILHWTRQTKEQEQKIRLADDCHSHPRRHEITWGDSRYKDTDTGKAFPSKLPSWSLPLPSSLTHSHSDIHIGYLGLSAQFHLADLFYFKREMSWCPRFGRLTRLHLSFGSLFFF